MITISRQPNTKTEIIKADRGLEDDYKITYYEHGVKQWEEYGNADYIEYQYGVII